MAPIHVDPHDGLPKRRIRALDQIVVQVLLVVQLVQALEHKLEQRPQVLRRRRRDKDVRVSQRQGPGNREPQARRLTTSPRRGQRHRASQHLLARRVQERHDGLGLIQRPTLAHQRPRRLHIAQRLGQLLQLPPRDHPLGLFHQGPVCLLRHRRNPGHVRARRQDVELVVHQNTRTAPRKRQHETLVEPGHHRRVALCAQPLMHVHRQRVQLRQRVHVGEQKDDDAPALHGLHRPRQQVGRQRLKVLQHEHTVRIPENLMRVVVIAVADVRRRHKQRERVLLLRVQQSSLAHLLDLLHTLLPVRRQVQVRLVHPEHRRAGLDDRLAEHEVKIHYLLPALVADDDEQGPMVRQDGILNQRPDTTVDLLPHWSRCGLIEWACKDGNSEEKKNRGEEQRRRTPPIDPIRCRRSTVYHC